jgi:imidazolonepropionase-like amidohydrolase
LTRYAGRYDQLAIEAAQIALRNGVTTVFDNFGPRDELIKARNKVDEGTVVASRIRLSGGFVGLGGPYTDDMGGGPFRVALPDPFIERINSMWQCNVGPELARMPPEEVRREVREYVSSGIDFLTYSVNVHRASGSDHFILFSPRVQRIIVEEAHRAGLPAGGFYTSTSEGLLLALEAGVDFVQACELADTPRPMSGELVAMMAERQVPCGLMPSTEKTQSWAAAKAGSNHFLGRFAMMDANERALVRQGAAVMMATGGGLYERDVTNTPSWQEWNPQEENLCSLEDGHFTWLLAMHQKGMDPMGVLMAATRNVAKAFRVDGDLGTLEPGKLADLIVLDRDPLRSAEHYREINLVMKEGRIVDRDALPTARLLTAHDV